MPVILKTLDSVLNQGIDIQLKVLQTILSVLTYCGDVHGPVLGDVSPPLTNPPTHTRIDN